MIACEVHSIMHTCHTWPALRARKQLPIRAMGRSESSSLKYSVKVGHSVLYMEFTLLEHKMLHIHCLRGAQVTVLVCQYIEGLGFRV